MIATIGRELFLFTPACSISKSNHAYFRCSTASTVMQHAPCLNRSNNDREVVLLSVYWVYGKCVHGTFEIVEQMYVSILLVSK
jgi:uncharacterized protein